MKKKKDEGGRKRRNDGKRKGRQIKKGGGEETKQVSRSQNFLTPVTKQFFKF